MSRTMILSLAALVLVAAIPPTALADGEGSEAPLWVVAEVKQTGDDDKGPRTVYFCGRARLPKGTKVDVFLRRKGNIFNAARAVVEANTPYFRKARAALGARAGEAVNFGGYIGPLSNMVLGEWDLLFVAKTPKGEKHKTTYPLVVGDVSKALDEEAAEAARLTKRVDELEQRYKAAKELFAVYAEHKTWTKKDESAWTAKANPMIIGLARMSDQTLAERAKVLAPIFPFVQMVLTQMPLKLKDLILSHHDLYQERAGKKPKPKTFERTAAIGRIEEEIVRHIKLARERLGTRESVTLASFFLDVSKLDNLIEELDRQRRRAWYTKRFDPAIWNGYADSAVRHIEVFSRRVKRYEGAKGLFESNPRVLSQLADAVGIFGRLVDIFSAELYRKHKVAESRQRKHDPTLPDGAKDGKALLKTLRKRVAEVRSVVEGERAKTRAALLARYQTLRADALEMLAAADRGSEGYEAFANGLQRKLEANKFPITSESKAYFPGAVENLEVLNRALLGLTVEQRDLFTLGAEGEMTIRGEKIVFDRNERVGQLVNELLRALLSSLRAMEHHDLKLTRTAVAWLKKRNRPVDEKVRTALEALASDSEK